MSQSVILLGTGVGIPQPGRSQSSLIFQADKTLLFDCGAGTLNRLTEAGCSPLGLDAVFLTHLHLDHVADLLPLAKARYLCDELKLLIHGPQGTERWLSASRSLYPYLDRMELEVEELSPGDFVLLEGLRISTAEAVHSVPTLGYRIDAEGKRAVYSGDTEPAPTISELAKGADLLVHECSFPEPYQVTNHSTPRKLGEAISQVRRVVLTHLYPQCQGHEEEMARTVAAGCGAEVEVGRDLMVLEL